MGLCVTGGAGRPAVCPYNYVVFIHTQVRPYEFNRANNCWPDMYYRTMLTMRDRNQSVFWKVLSGETSVYWVGLREGGLGGSGHS